MKANRSAQGRPRDFRADERGVSEAVGYIITFGISTIVLVTSLQAFMVIQRHAGEIAVDRAVNEVAAQVAFAVDEALRAGATYPDANFTMTVTIPREVSGETFNVTLYKQQVWVEATNAHPDALDGQGNRMEVRGRATAQFVQRDGADVHCSNPNTVVPGGVCSVRSDEGEVTVTFADPDGTNGPWDHGVYFKR